MIINDIGLKNFKSYGNNMQKVYFKEGELILLSGDNESGKSTLIESIDFTIYGIVRGKNKSKITLAKLPNRQNKNLETEINFINDDGDKVLIKRKLEPTSFEIFKNGKSFFKEFKHKIKYGYWDESYGKFYVSFSKDDQISIELNSKL